MPERVSLTQISEFMVQRGVPPQKAFVNDATSSTYLELPTGWRGLPLSDVLSMVSQAPATSFTDSGGDLLADAVVPTTVGEQYDAGILGQPVAPVDPQLSKKDLGHVFTESVAEQPLPASSPGGGSAYGGPAPGGGGLPSGFIADFATAQFPAQPTMRNYGSSGGYQEQVYVPGGAAAGPFENRAAPGDPGPYLGKRAFNESGRAYADQGTHRSPLYNQLRARGDAIASRVRGMASNIGSGGYGGGYSGGGGYGGGSYRYPSYPSSGRSSSSSGYEPLPVEYEKNTGFSKRYDEETLNETILGNPHAVLPRIMDVGEMGYDWVRGLDAGALVELGAGTGKKSKNWMGEDQVNDYGYVTPGVIDQGKYTNALGSMFTDLKRGEGQWLNQGKALSNLTGAPKKSYVGEQFVKDTPINDQATAAARYLNAIAAMGPGIGQGAYMYAVQNDMDTWTEENLRKKKPGSLLKSLRSQGWR